MARRVGLIELEMLRRRRKKTLVIIAMETGLNVCAVWRVMRQRSFDLRKIARVARAIGVPLHRLDLASFLAFEQSPNPDRSTKAQAEDPHDGQGQA